MPRARTESLVCPVCRMARRVGDTHLLQAEAAWLATGASDSRRQPGWSVEEVREGRLQWACAMCFRAGRAIEGHPARQTWCDHNPYFAFVDVTLHCEDCDTDFVFAAKEQQFWYETLKFYVQSRPKQCAACRKARRAKNRPPGAADAP